MKWNIAVWLISFLKDIQDEVIIKKVISNIKKNKCFHRKDKTNNKKDIFFYLITEGGKVNKNRKIIYPSKKNGK